MKPFTHDILQRGKHGITRAVAGMEVRLRIGVRQPVGEFTKFILRLMAVEQMEASHNLIHGEGRGGENVFQSAVGTAREQQTAKFYERLR